MRADDPLLDEIRLVRIGTHYNLWKRASARIGGAIACARPGAAVASRIVAGGDAALARTAAAAEPS